MNSDEQAMLGGRLSTQSKDDGFQAGDSQPVPRTRNGLLTGLSFALGQSQTLKEGDLSPKKLIEMKRERYEAEKNSQMLLNRISLLEKQEHKMLSTIQRVQQRAAQLTEIQRFQESRIRLKTEAEESKLNLVRENQERIRQEKERHRELMQAMKQAKYNKLSNEAK